jgi:metal-responsive CopG/Arc/MetJ family transcriptional regulator
MKPMSLKLSEDLQELIDRLAAERHLSRSAVVREAIQMYATAQTKAGDSAASLAGDLVGALNGPRDLSTSAQHLDGFGE